MDFVTYSRQGRKPVTLDTIQKKAIQIRDELLLLPNLPEDKRTVFSSFSASKWWAISFIKRHALWSVSLHGEGGSAKALNIAKEIAELRKKVRDYLLSQNYNMDETGLFY